MPPHAYFLLGCLRLRYIGVGYHQNIREWGKKPAVEWLPIFRQMFWAPVPQEPPAPLPSSTDLVIYFRSFFDRSFFDVWHMQMRVGHMPLAYYRWAAQHHRRVVTWPLAEQFNYVRLGAGITSTESAVAASSAPQTNRYGTLKSGEMFRALLHCCADLYGSDGPAVCRSHQGLELSWHGQEETSNTMIAYNPSSNSPPACLVVGFLRCTSAFKICLEVQSMARYRSRQRSGSCLPRSIALTQHF